MSLVFSVAQAQNDNTALIDNAYSLYDEGKFEAAEVVALRALSNSDQYSIPDRARLHRLLGFIYVVLAENDKARRQFLRWLEIDETARLDPLYISPKIINVFNEAKVEYEARIVEEPPPDVSSLTIQRQAFQRSLIFPGLGQWYEGKRAKGVALIASEVICLGAFAFCQMKLPDARDEYHAETDPAKMQDLYDDYNLYYRGRYASLICAAGIYLYSLWDILHFPPPESSAPGFTIMLQPDQRKFFTLSLTLPSR